MLCSLWIPYKNFPVDNHCDTVVITTAQLHSIKPELRFFGGSNPARGVSEIDDGENV